MDPLTALVGQLDQLAHASGADADGLGNAVRDLATQMNEAVPSLVGLNVTTIDTSHRMTLTVTGHTEPPALTSLRFSIPQPLGRSTQITIYASRPGALVDLHADLTYLPRGAHPHRDQASRTIEDLQLDQDLPAPALEPGLAGQEARSTLDRAEGALIDQGAPPDEAGSQLALRAATAGLEPYPYARQLLDTLSAGPDPERKSGTLPRLPN